MENEGKAWLAVSLASISAALLAGCESTPVVETRSVAAPLPALAQPASYVGDEWHYVNQDGEEGVITTTAIDAGRSTRVDERVGCSWTADTRGFGPAYTFSGCSGSSGAHVVKSEGSMWPLQLGTAASFDYKGSNDRGDSWSGTRKCEVVEEVAITTAAGDFDTYHVQCVDHSRTRDWYISAADGRTVLYTSKHRKRNTLERLEMTRVVPGVT